MSESYAKPSDLRGKEICFLLDVDYQGSIRRFSTFPIDITDTADNTLISYNGGLNDPDITEQTSFVGFDLDANIVPMELVFYDVDWISEWTKGRLIDNSICTISMITVEDGQTSFSIQSRVVLFKGRAIGGIFGVPDKPLGFIAFSIENNISTETKKLIEPHQTLSLAEFPSMLDRAVGKIVPLVFGKPGPYPVGYADYVTFFDRLEATPAYPIDNQSTYAQYIICYGLVKATNLRIWDSTGGNFVNPVSTALDSEGRVYSYVQYNVPPGSNVEDNSFFPVGDDDQQFWVQWSEYDGSLLDDASPDGYLTGAGDICLYFLDKSGLDYDEDEWEGMRLLLNKYKFAGYVNDTTTDIWSWLKDSIIKYLPIEVVNGGKGIKPVLNLYFWSHDINPSHILETSGDFEVITGIQPLDSNPLNKITIRFCWEGVRSRYRSTVVIQGDLEGSKQTSIRYNTGLASTSYQQFGLREEVVEIPHLYDIDTAYRIAGDAIRMRALGAYGLDISAAPRYGYIMLGDIISLTSDVLGVTDWKCQVIAKRWESNRWKFTIFIENNNYINLAQI
jgi:hypothetical protein